MDRNEAIEIVRMCCPKIANSKCDFETAMRVLVPELKESEDEMIRKFLVDYFEVIKSTLTDGMWKGFQIDKILALLEKQGEQKSVDMAKPKFKVGDWVVCCDYEPEQIIGIRTNVYEMSNGDIRPFYMIDNNYNIRPWTIQDAKDGDILIEKKDKKPFIFRGLLDPSHPGYPVAYGGIEISDTFMSSSNSKWWTDKEICPATKEQRDFLFQEMKEAGYEWDADKKELRKIEQKSNSFKAEHGKYYYCIKDYFSGGKKQASKGDVVQALRGLPIMGLDDASEFFLPVNNIKNNRQKFNVGDFVIHRDYSNIIYRVQRSWGDNTYMICPYFDSGKAFTAVSENSIHLWTINDAKPGDVLYSTRVHATIIFKGWSSDNKHIIAYCALQQGMFIEQEMLWDTDFEPAIESWHNELFSAMSNSGYTWDDEKKKIVRNKPMYKVGDWVVLSSGSLSEILQIVRIDLTSKYYWFDDDSYLPIVDEDCLHLWRPQDAEDGDILVITKDGDPFIFKGFLDKFHPDSPVAYGGIISNGTFDISSGDGWWDGGEISPANKEQRDLLFQKMKEAGYEWDAEKKELKTIEHNPADNIELSAFKDKLLELFQKFRWFKKSVPTNGDIIEYVDTHIQELINTIHNPAWSEEDEKNELKPIE